MRSGWLGCIVIVMAVATANADTVRTGTYGLWHSFEGTSNDGTEVCGINASGSDRGLFIKYFVGQPGFVMQIFKSSWVINTQISVRVQISLGTSYLSNPLNATAYPGSAGGYPFVEIGFRSEGSSDFWQALRSASSGRLDFLTGTEGAWTINLTGSNAAVSALMACIQRRGGPALSAPPRTQPFNSAPTQPFSSGSPTTPTIPAGPSTRSGAPKLPPQ